MGETSLRLRPITEADLPDYLRWFADPEVAQFLGRERGDMTMEMEREWLAQINAADPACERYWAIDGDGRHIGNCALRRGEAQGIANFGIAIGDKAAWGKGYGTAALREVLRIGFAEMGLRRIHLVTFTDNPRAIRCYEKCGFRHEGLRRQARLKDGHWRDEVLMAILREEWEKLNPSPSQGLSLPTSRSRSGSRTREAWRLDRARLR